MTDGHDHFRARVIQDALTAASAHQWDTRAERFEWARPRPTDHPGGPVPWTGRIVVEGRKMTAHERVRWYRLTELAQAARAQAKLIRGDVAA